MHQPLSYEIGWRREDRNKSKTEEQAIQWRRKEKMVEDRDKEGTKELEKLSTE